MYEKVAILVTVCGRNLTCKTLDETPFFKIFLPFFNKTKENFDYKIYIGIDDNDAFFLPFLKELESNSLFKVVLLQDCNHKPSRAWNILFKTAYEDGYEYFFQVGDDVAIISSHWTSRFIQTLRNNGNFGVTGPSDEIIFQWRKERKLHQVIENAFVHRTHYDIFQTMFHPQINNQFCDDWITLVYDNFALINLNIKSENTVRNARYTLEKSERIKEYIDEGKIKIRNFRDKIKIVDCFLFHNEFDLLQLRLEELNEVVDRFVIVEANITHANSKKDWNFEKNKSRYEKYLSKIIYIQCDKVAGKSSWEIENNHRNGIANCFHHFSDSDIFLMSDLDEIPRSEIIRQIKSVRLPLRLQMQFFNYNFNCRVIPDWQSGTVVFHKTMLSNAEPQSLRLAQSLPFIENAGWHFSWFGDEQYCKDKIKSFAHQELNNDYIVGKFGDRMKKYEDYFVESGRNWRFSHIYLLSDLPKTLSSSYLSKYIDSPKHNLYFITYGDSKFAKSRKRIIKEAEDCNIFRDCMLYTEDSLSEEFQKDFAPLLSQSRGGGYWCWKLFIILDALKKTEKESWIIYADAGCKFYKERKSTLFDLLSYMIMERKVISAFAIQNCLEKTWTKGDMIDFFGCRKRQDIVDSEILMGGIFVFRNCKEVQNFFSECYDIAKDHPELIDDSPSSSLNFPQFIEHRHDQSLLSMKRKLRPDLVYTTKDPTWDGDFLIMGERLRE